MGLRVLVRIVKARQGRGSEAWVCSELWVLATPDACDALNSRRVELSDL